MGVKTMREDFGTQLMETYYGVDNDDATKVSYQDAYFTNGRIEEGDGDPAILATIKALATAKDFQNFKKYVDVESMIATELIYMFTDTECEWNGVVSNTPLEDGGKMIFNVNDTDGAFWNNGKTGTTSSAFIGGCGTYRHKWGESKSRAGAGGYFGTFSGNSTTATAGNLEFKTLVKDMVLKAYGTADSPLREANVRSVISSAVEELTIPYRLDAAFMGVRKTIYTEWLAYQPSVLNQVSDRVAVNMENWAKYNMTHTLKAIEATAAGDGYTLNTTSTSTIRVYYTTDGSDPMGANGAVSSTAMEYTSGTVPAGAVIRPFQTNNWGPKTVAGK
jgi:hypothetical protein